MITIKGFNEVNFGCETKATENIFGYKINKVLYDVDDNVRRYCRYHGEYTVVDSTFESGILYFIINKTNSKETTKLKAKYFSIIDAAKIEN